jgi:hypothetical protein
MLHSQVENKYVQGAVVEPGSLVNVQSEDHRAGQECSLRLQDDEARRRNIMSSDSSDGFRIALDGLRAYKCVSQSCQRLPVASGPVRSR